ncbi:MAG: hypothetical protein J6A62_01360 [Oscillospiraceae bacterium]|nr:hypothetical protein [Oscillospiraceae bacterium]
MSELSPQAEASDMELATKNSRNSKRSPTKWVRFEEEEQRNERAFAVGGSE